MEIELKQWLEEGKNLFGDVKNWSFICPACKHISTVQDFIDVGAEANDAYVECIGRRNGKGADGMKGKDNFAKWL